MRKPALFFATVLVCACQSSAPKGAPAPQDDRPAGTAMSSASPTDLRAERAVPTVAPVSGRGLPGGVRGHDKGLESGGGPNGQEQRMASHVVTGGVLVEEDVRRTVEASFSSFDVCYPHVGGAAKGSLHVRLAIQPEGAVSESVVTKSSFRVAKFDDCVAGAAKAIRFPKAQSGSSFVVPLEFDR